MAKILLIKTSIVVVFDDFVAWLEKNSNKERLK